MNTYQEVNVKISLRIKMILQFLVLIYNILFVPFVGLVIFVT